MSLFSLNPNTKKRLERFRQNKRAWWSLNILILSYVISLFSSVIANNHPLIIKYNSNFYFPVFQFYPETTFGGSLSTEPNYKRLARSSFFQSPDNYMIFPPLSFGPNEDNLEALEEGVAPPTSPDSKHLMGTDNRGRDVFTRIIYGYRIALSFSFLLIFFEILIGVIAGGIQGYFAGVIDLIFQRIVEILSAIPMLYLILIIGSFFGRSFMVLLFTYALLNWIGISYYMRGEFLKLRSMQFVEAARAFGVPATKIIMRHILPNALTPIVTFLPFSLIASISALSALDFLGYGLPPPTPSWGELIGQGREMISAWWLITFPSIALFITILLSAFVGEGLRDAFDPKARTVFE